MVQATEMERGPETTTAQLNLIEALNRAFDDEMAGDDRVMVLGQDVGRDGGIFRVTDGLLDKYGEERVVDTPISEAAIAGACLGLAIAGMRPCGEMQFSGFSYQAFHQFEQNLARYRKRSQGRFPVNVVIRMPYGAGVRALEHHSESKETVFIHNPGLKVVMPSGPKKAYQYLRAAFRDPDPVIYMEPKYLYRRFKEEVEVGVEADVPPLKGSDVVREGDDVTIVSWGAMLHRAAGAATKLEEEHDVGVELIDVGVLNPMDHRPINESVRKTGRCVVFHEAHRTLGLGAEVSARIAEDESTHFRLLAPVARVTAPDVTVPLLARENAYMPDEGRLVEAVLRAMDYA